MKMRKNEEEIEEVEEVEEVELSEKELKKIKQKEKAEKRKNAKKKDKVARWGGIILLGLFMFVGFLLLVFGEMTNEAMRPTAQPSMISPAQDQTGTVIVK